MSDRDEVTMAKIREIDWDDETGTFGETVLEEGDLIGGAVIVFQTINMETGEKAFNMVNSKNLDPVTWVGLLAVGLEQSKSGWRLSE